MPRELKQPRFEDYHRTIVGYHGTRRSTADQIVARRADFVASKNDDDWLGHGVYFWEHAPQRAWEWARARWPNEEVAVLGSMIRLGRCFDLLEPANAELLVSFYRQMTSDLRLAGTSVPKNFNAKKRLDCAVFEYAAAAFEMQQQEQLDSIRAVYVPTSGAKRLWSRSWLYREAHIQLCIRNPECILGTWLLRPVEE